MRITSDLFNLVLKNMDNYVESYKFHHNGVEPVFMDELEDIKKDIVDAYNEGQPFVYVEDEVLAGLLENGVFEEVVG